MKGYVPLDRDAYNKHYAVIALETQFCSPVVLCILICCVLLATVCAGYFSFQVPTQYLTKSTSTTNCPEHTTATSCTNGKNLLHSPFDTIHIPKNDDEMNHNLILFARPHSTNRTFAVISKVKTTTYFIVVHQDPLHLLFTYHGLKTDINISVTNTSALDDISAHLGDFIYDHRYDNPNYEWHAFIFRTIAMSILFIMILVYLIQFVRVSNPIPSNVKWFFALMLALLPYSFPWHILHHVTPYLIFNVIDGYMQTFGLCFILLYILVSLGSFTRSRDASCGFYTIRICYTIFYGIWRLGTELYISLYADNDPTASLQNVIGFRVFGQISYAMTLLWVFWVLHSFIRCLDVTRAYFNQISGRFRLLLAIHLFYLIFFIAVLVAMLVRFSSERSGAVEAFKYVGLISYALLIGFLYLPTTSDKRATSVPFYGALHPQLHQPIPSLSSEEEEEGAALRQPRTRRRKRTAEMKNVKTPPQDEEEGGTGLLDSADK